MNNDELINNFNKINYEISKINNDIIKLNNYKNNIINDISIIKYLITDNNNNNNNNIESYFNKQEHINMKLNNEIKNINYNIQETSIDITCKFNKNLANFIKEQKETNKKLKDELIELRNIIDNSNYEIIKKQDEKIKYLYYNIFYISISFIFITIFI